MLRRLSLQPVLRPLQTRGYAAAPKKTVAKKDNFKKTRSLGFKLKKAAPTEKKKISASAQVKPFRETVHRAGKIADASDLPAFGLETLKNADPVVLSYQGAVSKACAIGGAFAPDRGFELLRERSTLLRKESRDLFAALDAGNAKIVLAGPTKAGKRELVAQAMAYAQTKGWIVLPAPQMLQYVNGTSDYALTESGRLDLLRRNCEFFKKLANSNAALGEAKLSQEYSFGPLKLTKDNSILDLCKKGVSTRFQAGEIFEAVIHELSLLNTPVLQPVYAVDVLARNTEYRTPEYRQIKASELQLAQLIKNPPMNFVQVLAPTGGNETEVALGSKPAEHFVYDPRFDSSVVQLLSSGTTIKVEPASSKETAVLMDYYKSRGLDVEKPEKLHVTSGGLLGELWRHVRAY
ncbi:hypothetical protein CJU89_6709 [Yarrowia sp. B02]|nr:hypothetical protein CJU89_6709 [Yarrowia sp. B02]